jgi:hypothetical protein
MIYVPTHLLLQSFELASFVGRESSVYLLVDKLASTRILFFSPVKWPDCLILVHCKLLGAPDVLFFRLLVNPLYFAGVQIIVSGHDADL